MQNNDWTYEEFRAFAMLYAANTDGYITADEENLIATTLPADKYVQIKERFQKCSDVEAIDIIVQCKEKYCTTPADTERVLADMRKIYEAHHGFEQIERGVHLLFRRLFG